MNKFKKGDMVRYIGENDGNLRHGNVEYVSHRIVDLEPLYALSDDPTTAFLTELQNLLRKYDAEIGYRSIGDIWSCYLITVGGQSIKYEMDCITPDNIFDYEK